MSHTENNLKFHCGFCIIYTSPTGKTQHIIMHTYMEFILVACTVAIASSDMLYLVMECIIVNDGGQCVRMKCCSNTSTHAQFLHLKTHF